MKATQTDNLLIPALVTPNVTMAKVIARPSTDPRTRPWPFFVVAESDGGLQSTQNVFA